MNTLLFDVGGTTTRMSRTDGRGLSMITKFPTPRAWPAARKAFVRAADSVMKGKKVHQVIGGLPGTLSPNRQSLLAAPNLPGWVKQPLQADLRYIFQAPIRLENDASLNGLGEAVFGSGRKFSTVGFMTISTGINGVLCVNGDIDRGQIPYELRQLLVTQQGRIVTLERAISGAAIRRLNGEAPENIHDRRVWKHAAESLGMAIQNLLLAWRPDILILGGSIIRPSALRITEVNAALAKTWRLPFPRPAVVAGKLGDESGLWGGVALAKHPIR